MSDCTLLPRRLGPRAGPIDELAQGIQVDGLHQMPMESRLLCPLVVGFLPNPSRPGDREKTQPAPQTETIESGDAD